MRLAESGRELIHDRNGLSTSLNTRVFLPRDSICKRCRVHHLPEPERMRVRIGRDHALQLGAAGARQPGDDDRVVDLLVEYFRMIF